MRPKVLIIAALSIMAIALAFIYWQAAHPARKIPAPKRRAAPAVKKRYALPPVTRKFANPKVAIVMDDFGYNMNNLDDFFNIRKPITLSVLPNLPYSARIAALAREKGYEVILHLPLEPRGENVRQEADTINSRMRDEEVVSRLEGCIKSVGGPSGASNHMGSKSTEEKALMTVIFKNLKRRGMYFFDSLTSQQSVCQNVAREVGIRYARRDIFLDMGKADDTDYIKKQVLEMRKMAFRRGRAIAVCHDRKNTIKVLASMMPDLASDGIRFVYLSELVS